MNHDTAKEKLSAFYDGELPETERQDLENHLKDCEACRDALEEMNGISRAFFSVPQVNPSEAFVTRVMANLEEGREPSGLEWVYARARLILPAVGVGIAVAAFLFISPAETVPVTTESLLLVDGREGEISQWAFNGYAPETDELLKLTLEEP